MNKLYFCGIDNWNRPIFKNEDKYYGSVMMLFDYEATKEEVLNILQVENLEYFGRSFGCEPQGGKKLSRQDYIFA